MSYRVKEIFYSIQGEGFHAGRPAVFCRFSGCNLWSGREEDRASAVCKFCDTDFRGIDGPGGGTFESAVDLAKKIVALWPGEPKAGNPFVVLTGGEPLLQVDAKLVDALHVQGFEVAVETNGTVSPPPGLDWICVSPKNGAEMKLRFGQELKLVFPQTGMDPGELEQLDFSFFYIQPMDGPDRVRNMQKALRYCRENPKWRLSLQIHKWLGIP